MIDRTDVIPENIHAAHLSQNFRKGRYGLWVPSVQPATFNITSSIVAFPTGAATQIDAFRGGSLDWELSQLTAQTLMPVIHATKGLEISLDQPNDETVEYVPGGNRITNPAGFKTNSALGLGGDIGWFYRYRVEITAANGMDQLAFGLRDVEAYRAVASVVSLLNGGNIGYASGFAMGIASAAASPANISTIGITASISAVTAAAFTAASTVVHDYEVRVWQNQAYGFINGVQLGGVVRFDALGNAITVQATQGRAGFALTASTNYVPWILTRQDAVTTTVFISQFEWGPLFEVNRDPSNRWG